MGKDKAPPPPDTPDYTGATREGIFADIESMPTRRQIESAYRLGKPVTYTTPAEYIRDSSGKYELKDGKRQLIEGTGVEKTMDFTGIGDIDITGAEAEALMELAPKMSQAQLNNLIEFGPQFIAEQREQMQQLDPEGFDLREDFARKLRMGEGTSEELVGEGVEVPEYLEAGAAPELADVGRTSEGRAGLEERIFDRLALGEKLSPDQQRALEQDVLRAGSRRGQALSGGTALREVLAKFGGGEELGRQRRGEALGLLSSGQATSDTTNRRAQANFANMMQQIQQSNQAKGATFAAGQQNLGQRAAARQQDVGNIQSMLGLQPVAAQGGYLSGLQQGAAPFSMPQMQRGTALDPNAAATAAGFAGNVFGTQGDMWSTQAQIAAQPSGIGQLVGGVLGAFGGGYGEALGKNWGNRRPGGGSV